MRNQLIYLKSNPELVKNIDTFVFVWNSGDFDKASSWSCEQTHPTHTPPSAFVFAFQKYVLKFNHCPNETEPEFLVAYGDWHKELKAFMDSPAMKNKKVEVFLYPDLNEEKNMNLVKEKLEIHVNEIHQAGISKVFSVRHDPRWNASYYRDDIHPNAKGNEVLADIISKPSQIKY